MFCRSLFVLLYFFFWPLCCLFFYDIRILFTPVICIRVRDINCASISMIFRLDFNIFLTTFFPSIYCISFKVGDDICKKSLTYDCSLSLLGTGIVMKSGGVRICWWIQTSSLGAMAGTCTCFLNVNRIKFQVSHISGIAGLLP
jgi:hypothetical protein